MKIIGRNNVTINGERVELRTLSEEERKRLSREWNDRGTAVLGYERRKTA